MERAFTRKAILTACLLLLATPAFAHKVARGTAPQAQAMVARAIALFDQAGAKAALDRFTNKPGVEFNQADLYIFVLREKDGAIVAHAADRSLIGRDVRKIKDARGRDIGRSLLDRATPEGAWADYWWKDPISGKALAKSSWVVRHKGHVFGCGIYKP